MVMPDAAAGRRLRLFAEARRGAGPGMIPDLALAAGLSRSMVHRWFAGDAEPSMAACRKLAAALGEPRYAVVRAWDGDE